jgi:ATP-dependent Clp protease, protease subunit
MASNPPLPSTIYASFVGSIDPAALNRIMGNFAHATQRGVTTVHLMFQSTGGTVNDGIGLYNYLRSLPLELHIYNSGAVQSIAVIGYVAGTYRHVSQSGTFFIHKTGAPAQAGANAPQVKATLAALVLDDARTVAILKAHTRIPAHKWAAYRRGDVTFSAQEAINFGIADDIREFQVPPGNQIFNI